MSAMLFLAILVLMIASIWVIFTKAGQPGWASIIPIYNIIVMLKIAGKPWWWIFGLIIPLVNIIVAILATIGLAKAFGKDVAFALGLILLGFIFYPILAFGDAKYTAPAAAS